MILLLFVLTLICESHFSSERAGYFRKTRICKYYFYFFVYVFVNIGMVSGVLPVVGVPLPFVSYGGTSVLTLFAGFGVVMSIQNHRRISL